MCIQLCLISLISCYLFTRSEPFLINPKSVKKREIKSNINLNVFFHQTWKNVLSCNLLCLSCVCDEVLSIKQRAGGRLITIWGCRNLDCTGEGKAWGTDWNWQKCDHWDYFQWQGAGHAFWYMFGNILQNEGRVVFRLTDWTTEFQRVCYREQKNKTKQKMRRKPSHLLFPKHRFCWGRLWRAAVRLPDFPPTASRWRRSWGWGGMGWPCARAPETLYRRWCSAKGDQKNNIGWSFYFLCWIRLTSCGSHLESARLLKLISWRWILSFIKKKHPVVHDMFC